MNEEKLKRFVQDEQLFNDVFSTILGSFLKKKGTRTIEIYAAERMAVELLEEAKKDFARFASSENVTAPPLKQVGM